MCLTFSKFFLSSVHEFILTHPYISFKVHSYVLAIMIFLVYILLVAGQYPAPADPGNSKARRLQCSGYNRIKDIKIG